MSATRVIAFNLLRYRVMVR